MQTLFSIITAIFFATLGVLTFASTKSRYEISLQSSLRVFESASLMVPLVGLVILNQFVVASIFGVGIIDSFGFASLGLQWYWIFAQLDVVLLNSFLLGDLFGLTCSGFARNGVVSIAYFCFFGRCHPCLSFAWNWP